MTAISGSTNRVYDTPKSMQTSPATQPVVQDLYEQLTGALTSLNDEVSMLDEKLGYILISACPKSDEKDGPVPERSPLAHNLYCTLCDVNRLAYRVQNMRGRLEI